MKALSLWQPWAWSMTVPPPPKRKGVENRTWPCPRQMIGKRFAVHASKTWDMKGVAFIRSNGLLVPQAGVDPVAFGAVIATAVISRVVRTHAELPEDQRKWFFGPYGFVFEDVDLLDAPVPCRGFQMFFELPTAVEDAVERQRALDSAERQFKQGWYQNQRADELVAKVGRALLGRAVYTPPLGDWTGGDCMVTDLGHDANAPEIVMNVERLTDGAQIGVFRQEKVRLIDTRVR